MIKTIKGLITFKEEPKTYLRKDGSDVLICNFYMGELKFTCFSDLLFEDFKVGERIHFEYKEKIDGLYTNRTVIRICNKIKLNPKIMKIIKKAHDWMDKKKWKIK